MATANPFASAVEAAERGNFCYGQVQVSAAFVVLQKGTGKSTFIEGHHDMKDRRTEVTMVLNPIEQSGFTQLVTRSMIAESAEWSRIVWPSLRDGCGMKDLAALDNQFVKVELVKNGRTWQDKKTGETREGTTFKFHNVYTDQAACDAAYVADGNFSRTTTAPDDTPLVGAAHGPNSAVNDSEREAAWSFVQTLAKQANGDKTTLASLLATMPPFVTNHYTVDSPEVAPLLKAA